MGNLCVFLVMTRAKAIELTQTPRHVPERANIGVVEVRDARHLRVRVWERATDRGVRQRCAALVAAVRRGLAERSAEIAMDGGSLRVVWNEADHVLMTGPALHSFRGHLDPEMLANA
jgi:diaminopimelate epimerase